MNEERYAAAPAFEEYLAGIVKNRDLWLSTYARARVDDAALQAVRSAGEWRLAALTEDWCGDAFNTLPYVAKLVTQAPNLQLRIFGRDANPDLMDSHLTKGSRSIPVVILYDADFREHGWWGPRPAPLQDWFERVGRAMEREDRYREMRRWYATDRGRTVLQEVAALLTKNSGWTVDGLPNLHRIA